MIFVLLVACNGSHNKKEVPVHTVAIRGELYDKKILIDTEKSYIKWRGTKLIGSAHEGTVKFKSGYLGFSQDTLAGGAFIADMATIYNTDIPLSDPVPRKNLTKHLNEDFETSKYPESSFIITHVMRLQSGKYEISGNLTIKGITHGITIEAEEEQNGYTAQFVIDRFDWKIGESGSWLEKKIVDAEIELEVYVVLN